MRVEVGLNMRDQLHARHPIFCSRKWVTIKIFTSDIRDFNLYLPIHLYFSESDGKTTLFSLLNEVSDHNF